MNTTIENHNLYVDKWRSIQNAMTDLQLDKTLIQKHSPLLLFKEKILKVILTNKLNNSLDYKSLFVA